jgi:hypothetical protein
LVIGLYFDRHLLPFRSEHVGLFWSSLRKDFPVIRQQPIVSPPVWGSGSVTIELVGTDEVYPMPRFWLEAPDGSTVMQLQKNAFLFNWRKKDAAYPHYETVKAAFDRNFARFTRFLDKELQVRPTLQIAELTYINVIESCEYWSAPGDTADVFPDFQVVSAGAPQPDFNQVASQQLAPDLSLTTSIRNGRRRRTKARLLNGVGPRLTRTPLRACGQPLVSEPAREIGSDIQVFCRGAVLIM